MAKKYFEQNSNELMRVSRILSHKPNSIKEYADSLGATIIEDGKKRKKKSKRKSKRKFR
jgi:hypothetical protein